MKQVHSTVMSKTLLKIENLKHKALLINYMKSKFTNKEIADSFEANFDLLKKEIQSTGLKLDEKFDEVAKKGKNQGFHFVVAMDKAKDSLLESYKVSEKSQKDQQKDMANCEMRARVKKTKRIHKAQRTTKQLAVKPVQSQSQIFYDEDSEKDEYLMELE